MFDVSIILEKLSTLLMVGFLGTSPSEETVQEMGRLIQERQVGSVLLLKRNTEQGPEVLKQLTQYLLAQMPEQNGPLLIAIDGEGGRVKRLLKSDGYTELPSAKEMAKLSEADFKALLDPYVVQLKNLGINWNLAPVVDVEVETERGCIGRLERSYSTDPKVVRHFAELVFQGYADKKIATCFKHWPGLGADMGDTHQGMTDLTEVWHETRDEAPFHEIIGGLKEKGIPQKIAVMTAHSVHRGLDPEVPSLTFSEKLIAQQRDKWGVDNLFISDDLDMGALDAFDVGDKVVRALLAGNDMVILSQYRNYDSKKIAKVRAHVKAVLEKQDDAAERLARRIEESAARVAAFKKSWFEEGGPF